MSQVELAAVLGVSVRQIRNLEAKGLPTRAEGTSKRYRLPDALRWYVSFKEAAAREAATPTDYTRALARKTAAEARMAELRLAELEAALIPAAVHAEVLGRVLDRIRVRLGILIGAWADRLLGIDDARKMAGRLRQMIDEVSATLSTNAEAIVSNVRQQEIPADFPETDLLRRAGVDLFGQLIDTDDLTELPGIGRTRARRIRAALAERGLLPDCEEGVA